MSTLRAHARQLVITLLIVSTAFAAGLGLGINLRSVPGSTAVVAAAVNEPEAFGVFWEAWRLVQSSFYAVQPLDDRELTYGAIRGLVGSLGDKYSAFLTPEEAGIFSQDLSGEFGGIGVSVTSTAEGHLLVVRVYPGEPAEALGLHVGDVIIGIDDHGLDGATLSDGIAMLRGPIDSDIRLTIRRADGSVIELAGKRSLVQVSAVDARMLEGNIGYVALHACSDRASDELRAVLTALLAQQPVGLVLDLRGNRGGYVHVAEDIISEFITDGVILIERDRNGMATERLAALGGCATMAPLVVLVDQSTASAAEIIAGALQDRGRAILIGTTTYGKGSVQITRRLADQSSIRLTIRRWYTPSGWKIDGQGLKPDIEVKRSDEDLIAQRDPPLARAVAYLLGER